jgi:hypothetical protein
MKLLNGNGPGSLLTDNPGNCFKCYQGRSRIRRMDNIALMAAEYAVELILASYRIAAIPAFAQAIEFAAIVPASRFLAYVAAKGALVSELGAPYF